MKLVKKLDMRSQYTRDYKTSGPPSIWMFWHQKHAISSKSYKFHETAILSNRHDFTQIWPILTVFREFN